MALFEDLKNCPFCGGKASLLVLKDGVMVKCLDCSMGTPTYTDFNYKTPMAIDIAIKQWNRRAKEGDGE